jgi:hypothetical protein
MSKMIKGERVWHQLDQARIADTFYQNGSAMKLAQCGALVRSGLPQADTPTDSDPPCAFCPKAPTDDAKRAALRRMHPSPPVVQVAPAAAKSGSRRTASAK